MYWFLWYVWEIVHDSGSFHHKHNNINSDLSIQWIGENYNNIIITKQTYAMPMEFMISIYCFVIVFRVKFHSVIASSKINQKKKQKLSWKIEQLFNMVRLIFIEQFIQLVSYRFHLVGFARGFCQMMETFCNTFDSIWYLIKLQLSPGFYRKR